MQTVARGKLIGVRFSQVEFSRIESLIGLFEQMTPGVKFNAQTVIKAALAMAETELISSRPKPTKKR
jgi:hypothetical protein